MEHNESMEYNLCKTCGACDGRAGFLINNECENCHETRKRNAVFVNIMLNRTQEELKKTMEILKGKLLVIDHYAAEIQGVVAKL